ncbi:thymocyte nuclear protein 1 isoform X2 [Arvicanthis niloticus]|uniref:thymocyte nuclear protein 1 isoform X2 n=1 Tax=Arvicanthis niloticus TaxID=61156 RepID=UPI001486CA3C|nr:thymocyte nuclear protein 1 isoform X1 [Arvicanthis niloticus]XP_034365749.1 thymocyte nuclear protein 1 isoform X1 [Arvicanthis niloticus]XP_034365750.1 thymocyte nuclear protein 1 isoform X1 [Arvicanthis niloticus]
MPRPRKRQAGAAGPDKKKLSGKRTKTENSGSTLVKLENSSPEKTTTFKNGGNYWLMKSEPESRLENGIDMKFSIEDLKAQPKQTACWDGVRNYQARNFLRAMKLEDEAFFYHSNCKQPGIVGLMKIVKEAYPDHTQFEKSNPHYDPSSKEDNPKWSMVDVQFVRMMKRFISLEELKTYHQTHKVTGGPLQSMTLFTRQRLSVQRLTQGKTHGELCPHLSYPRGRLCAALFIVIYPVPDSPVFEWTAASCRNCPSASLCRC